MNSERANFEKKITVLRSTHVPQKRHSETMSDNENEKWREEKHCKNSVFRSFWWSVMVFEFGAEKRT